MAYDTYIIICAESGYILHCIIAINGLFVCHVIFSVFVLYIKMICFYSYNDYEVCRRAVHCYAIDYRLLDAVSNA